MKVLIIGSGGREHALAWKIAQSAGVEKIYCAPGNAGIAALAECVDIKAMEFEKLADFAKDHEIDLTVVGMDDPLVGGIVDVFEQRGLRVFGPRKNAAILEGSKAFSKALMEKYDIPTASYETFTDLEAAKSYLYGLGHFPVVLKASGLALGKGVLICQDLESALEGAETIMGEKKFGHAGDEMVIEERKVPRPWQAAVITLSDKGAAAGRADHLAREQVNIIRPRRPPVSPQERLYALVGSLVYDWIVIVLYAVIRADIDIIEKDAARVPDAHRTAPFVIDEMRDPVARIPGKRAVIDKAHDLGLLRHDGIMLILDAVAERVLACQDFMTANLALVDVLDTVARLIALVLCYGQLDIQHEPAVCARCVVFFLRAFPFAMPRATRLLRVRRRQTSAPRTVPINSANREICTVTQRPPSMVRQEPP